MRYRLLGKSGLRVSEICLGTMTFGEEWGWGSSKKESKKVFDAFVEAGGNFIDTANFYTGGSSENFLGEFMGSEREKYVLATKYTLSGPTTDPNASGNSRKNMMQAVEASLRRLNTDYIDVYILHARDFMTPMDEVMRAFDDLVRSGKVLYIGISDTPAWMISRANLLAELKGWTAFTSVQLEYSLIERTIERELLPMARALDLTVTAWSPLSGGLLTGKYTRKKSKSDAKRLETAPYLEITEKKLAIAREVDKIADKIGRTSSQVAINWVRQQKGVLPIIGARTLSQLKDNLSVLEFELTEKHMARLSKVSAIEMGFPHDFLETAMIKSFVYGEMFDQIDNHHF